MKKAAGIEEPEEDKEGKGDSKPAEKAPSSRLVTSDGTYATQSAFSMAATKSKADNIPSLRKHLMDGDFFIGASLASCLAKLVRRLCLGDELSAEEGHKYTAEAIFIMTSILRYGSSGLPVKPITSDDIDRILLCIRVLAEDNDRLNRAFVEDCGKALSYMLNEQAEFEATHSKKKKKEVTVQPDDPISFSQLISKNDIVNGEDVFETSLSAAVGFNTKKSDGDVS